MVNASSMVINDQNVTHIGIEKDLESMCYNLLELDLAKNEIVDLNEVYLKITKFFFVFN